MRLVTRSDFDGLACAVFLKEAGIIDNWKFAHPKDLQDGLLEIGEFLSTIGYYIDINIPARYKRHFNMMFDENNL